MKGRDQCTVCTHPQRAAMELQLANRVPLRVISSRHGPSIHALSRHRKNHMSAKLQQRLAVDFKPQPVDLKSLKEKESEGLLQHLVAQRGRLYSLLDVAEQLQHIGDATKVHARLSENLRITGQLLGDLKSHKEVTHQVLLAHPAYHALRVALVQALRPFPEARQAVAAALRRIEEPQEVIEHASE